VSTASHNNKVVGSAAEAVADIPDNATLYVRRE
jgi:hypothetical protein